MSRRQRSPTCSRAARPPTSGSRSSTATRERWCGPGSTRTPQPSTRNSPRWNGRTDDGALAANGEYKFRIGSASGGGLETTANSRFGYYKFRFPLTAKHGYGDGYGAGRGHQGQDVFAKCGATLRAARGGRVQWNKTHSAAGNYLVIDGKGTRTDFMYAHLQASLAAAAR